MYTYPISRFLAGLHVPYVDVTRATCCIANAASGSLRYQVAALSIGCRLFPTSDRFGGIRIATQPIPCCFAVLFASNMPRLLHTTCAAVSKLERAATPRLSKRVAAPLWASLSEECGGLYGCRVWGSVVRVSLEGLEGRYLASQKGEMELRVEKPVFEDSCCALPLSQAGILSLKMDAPPTARAAVSHTSVRRRVQRVSS